MFIFYNVWGVSQMIIFLWVNYCWIIVHKDTLTITFPLMSDQVYIKVLTVKMSTIKMSTFSKCRFDMSKCWLDISKCRLDMSKCWLDMSQCLSYMSKCWQSEQKVDTRSKCRPCHNFCKTINSHIGIVCRVASRKSAKLNFV